MSSAPPGWTLVLLIAGALLCRAQWDTGQSPAAVADPLDFTGLPTNRLPLVSDRAFSWTTTRFKLQGVNVTDAYQPGRLAAFPDLEEVSEVVVQSGLYSPMPPMHGAEFGMSLREPGQAWHARLVSGGTGSSLASENLPPPSKRGILKQSEHYRWLTRENLEASGPLGKRFDVLLSTGGQWSSQTSPQADPGEDLRSRLLFGRVRGHLQINARNQLDAHWNGSRVRLSDWGIPAGIEAMAARRASPSFNSYTGSAGLKQTDGFHTLRAGWTRQAQRPSKMRSLSVHYGYSQANLDTTPSRAVTGQPRLDLETGLVGDTPPLANLAARTRHEGRAEFDPGEFLLAGRRHHWLLGGSLELAGASNRWNVPSGVNLVTVRGEPSFVVVFGSGLVSRSRILGAVPYFQDTIQVAPWLVVDAGVAADLARGWVPRGNTGQTGPSGDRIRWNVLSGKAGLALTPVSRLTLRGSYARTHAPLAGLYLDFGNPHGLNGSQCRWADSNADGLWQPEETGGLSSRFGGSSSGIDRKLRRPHADTFNLGAVAKLPLGISAAISLFRRDEKNRLAAVNTGIPQQAFRPVEIPDPGPDAIAGSFDDQRLTVYAQDPATLGHDFFLLTNPAGLRMMTKGVLAEAGGGWRFVTARASFLAVKSFGPTNPGNSSIENDAGVVGSLFMDPNSAIHAEGRSHFDRAYLAKAQLVAELPRRLGGIVLANTASYLDGLPFGRRLLVTGLPQGPFLVAATVRGSPEGGNRAEYVLDWNLRISRAVRTPRGSLKLAADVFNVLNGGNKVRESDVTGPLFNQRLPVAIQPPRFTRVTIEYLF